jgi:hypothetical protein
MEYIINDDGTVTRIGSSIVEKILLSDLNFTKKQLSAIRKIGGILAISSGNINSKKRSVVKTELLQIINGYSYLDIEQESKLISVEEAVCIVSNLTLKQKIYIKALFLTIICAGYNLEEIEKACLMYFSMECNLPNMTYWQANKIMVNL